jgi:hypothetical protein
MLGSAARAASSAGGEGEERRRRRRRDYWKNEEGLFKANLRSLRVEGCRSLRVGLFCLYTRSLLPMEGCRSSRSETIA